MRRREKKRIERENIFVFRIDNKVARSLLLLAVTLKVSLYISR